MRIVKPATIKRYWLQHRDARSALQDWLVKAQEADWKCINDVRKTYPHADAVKVASRATVTIFNIKGNDYHLMCAIHYNSRVIFIRDFMTHADYSRNQWKERH